MVEATDQDRQLGERPAALPAKEPTKRQAVYYPVFDRWSAHPGRKLTTAKLVAAYNSAELGYPADQCDIFDDREEADGHLRAQLGGRIQRVARKEWIVQAGGEADVDREAAKLLERQLRRTNIIETFEHQLTSNGRGWSLSEIHWERVKGLRPGMELAVPVWFDNVPHRRFQFDDFDRPLLVTRSGAYPEPLVSGRWWYTPLSGRCVAAAGLMRTAAWWSHFKTMTMRDWLVFANRFGIPLVYGQYEDNASDEDKDILKKAVQVLGSDGWAVFSEAAKITIAEANKTGGTGEVHQALLNVCNSEISKLIDGATLTTETQGPGSYALGTEHSGRSFELRTGDAGWLSNSFERYVGRPFCEFNSIPAEPPRLKFHLVRDEDPEKRAKVFDMALNKLRIPLDADQVRQELQLKAPSGEALEPPAAPAPAEGGSGGSDKPAE